MSDDRIGANFPPLVSNLLLLEVAMATDEVSVFFRLSGLVTESSTESDRSFLWLSFFAGFSPFRFFPF